MIEIFPKIDHSPPCPRCGNPLQPGRILWQGIHVCSESTCGNCGSRIVSDLPVGHAIYYPFSVDATRQVLYGGDLARTWLGKPLLDSLKNPDSTEIDVRVEKRASSREIVLLNCIDFLYGHALLKLWNLEELLQNSAKIVVIVQDFLTWMVPQGVAEVWSVKLPLSKAQRFYPKLAEQLETECKRFEKIYLHPAPTHPKIRNIALFTGTRPHDPQNGKFRITFVWREDRIWTGAPQLSRLGKKLRLSAGISRQTQKVVSLFSRLRRKFPGATFTVAGVGERKPPLPSWIDDQRVNSLTQEIERKLCLLYSESRLVTGVHGSHMLLPSAHAGMTVDLMPRDRWGNFGQDIAYLKPDNRVSSYSYRFLPIGTPISELAESIFAQIDGYEQFSRVMTE